MPKPVVAQNPHGAATAGCAGTSDGEMIGGRSPGDAGVSTSFMRHQQTGLQPDCHAKSLPIIIASTSGMKRMNRLPNSQIPRPGLPAPSLARKHSLICYLARRGARTLFFVPKPANVSQPGEKGPSKGISETPLKTDGV